MADHEDIIVHEADGIQEMDNKLPRWWVLLFQFSCVFALIYMLWFHVFGIGGGQIDKYRQEKANAEAQIAAHSAQAPAANYNAPAFDATTLATGGELFSTHCVSCHKPNASGLIGPNLTDAYWIHGATFADNMTVIAEGVPAKGMQAWKTMLSERQRHAVASYLYSLRGSQPESPKAPEGIEVAGSDSPRFGMGTL